MNIGRIINNIFMEHPAKCSIIGGTLIAGGAIYGACALVNALQRGPIHEIKNSPLTEQVDKFVKSEYNNPDIKNLECYKVDTFQVNPEMFTDYETLAEYLQDEAKSSVPRGKKDNFAQGVAVGIATKNIALGHAARQKSYPLYSPKTIKTIAQDKVYTDEKGEKFYIPVECYGEKTKQK